MRGHPRGLRALLSPTSHRRWVARGFRERKGVRKNFLRSQNSDSSLFGVGDLCDGQWVVLDGQTWHRASESPIPAALVAVSQSIVAAVSVVLGFAARLFEVGSPKLHTSRERQRPVFRIMAFSPGSTRSLAARRGASRKHASAIGSYAIPARDASRARAAVSSV